MTDRRLLVLAYFYPPLGGGGVHRVLSFTRHLPDHGWRCTVVCATPEDYWVTDPTLEREVHPGTEVIRVGGGSGLSAWLALRGGAGRERPAGERSGRLFTGLRGLSDWWLLPDSYAGWAPRARRAAAARIARGGVDAVLSSSPPDSVHLAGLGLRRPAGLPWVADFRDPWIGLHLRRPPTAWHRARHVALERAVLRGCDLALTASRLDAERLEERSDARPPRVVHLPNGFEPEAGHFGEGEGPERFRIVFTGTLSLMPDTEVFLEALHELLARRPEARRRLRATLAGAFDTGYRDRAVALGLSGIVDFPGPVAHAEARRLQRGAELLLLWKPRGCPTMVPGKLYEYLDAERAIVALLEAGDEAAELVRRAGGAVISSGDRATLAGELERRYAAWRAGENPGAPRPAWLSDYERARLTARLAGLLDELVAGPRADDARSGAGPPAAARP